MNKVNFSNVTNGWLTHEGRERTYALYTPSQRTTSMPLLIALHGGGGRGSGLIHITYGGFNRLAEQDSAVVVYPDGVDKRWHDGRGLSEWRAHRERVDDVGFIAALIERSDAPHLTPVPTVAAWEKHLLGLVDEESEADDEAAAVGLQFDLVVPLRVGRRPAQPAQIGLRPVLPGKNGNWVRSGISWTGVGYGGSGLGHLPRAQLQLLEEIAALDAASRRSYAYGANPPISQEEYMQARQQLQAQDDKIRGDFDKNRQALDARVEKARQSLLQAASKVIQDVAKARGLNLIIARTSVTLFPG